MEDFASIREMIFLYKTTLDAVQRTDYKEARVEIGTLHSKNSGKRSRQQEVVQEVTRSDPILGQHFSTLALLRFWAR